MTYDTECKIRDMKTKKYREQDGICAGCGGAIGKDEATHLAHILPQRKWVKKKYGEEIVYHELAMKLTHANQNCNAAVQMSPNKTELVNELVEQIRSELDGC
jgi:hypothetical protein